MVRPELSKPALILASASPRRRAFMEAAGVGVVVCPPDVLEVPREAEGPLDFCRRMATEKAHAGHEAPLAGDLQWALGSDTVVTIDGRILGKPEDTEDASRMLSALSGRTHQVITAWALAHRSGRVEVRETTTDVTFRSVQTHEISHYIGTGDPFDKAGAYGIQSGAGAFVTAIEGSYDGVVGLPLAEVLEHLQQLGVVHFPFGLSPRLARLRGAMAGAAAAAGRDPSSVCLVGVTKGQSPEKLSAALDLGVRALGENYVKEWEGKHAGLGDRPEWHFIGHLQRNKARFVAAHAARVHTVDSVRLAETLGRYAQDLGRSLPVLLQVDLAGEVTKSGVNPTDAPAIIEELHTVEGVVLEGLMAIPPAEPPSAVRQHFAALRRLRDASVRPGRPLPHLSIGMSGDFREAIAEGATLVRVGTALFGART